MLTNALPHRRRNVLFIAVDDLKPLIGAFGATHVHTPHMDHLAARGMIFENNHCQPAICGPSRASLMTGPRLHDHHRRQDLRRPMRGRWSWLGQLRHSFLEQPKKYWDLYDPATIEINPMQQHPEGAPFFVWQNSGELRSYSDAPKRGPIPTDFQRRLIHGYYASVSFADAQIGRLLDHLGETDNTIVCLWGDHGMFCKHTNYEQATRSPLILSAPGTCPEGVSTTAPTEFVDIPLPCVSLYGRQSNLLCHQAISQMMRAPN